MKKRDKGRGRKSRTTQPILIHPYETEITVSSWKPDLFKEFFPTVIQNLLFAPLFLKHNFFQQLWTIRLNTGVVSQTDFNTLGYKAVPFSVPFSVTSLPSEPDL